MTTTNPTTDWEAKVRADLEADLEQRLQAHRAAQALAAKNREFAESERAWLDANLPAETDRLLEQWATEKAARLRLKAELVAGEVLQRRRRADHARALTGPFSAENLAAVGRVCPGHAWPDIPRRAVPRTIDQQYWPATVRDTWTLLPDGIYRRLPKTVKSIPPGAANGSETITHPGIQNDIIVADLTDHFVASPVWPLAQGNNTRPRTYTARIGKTWKTISVPLLASNGAAVDVVSALVDAGVKLNPAPFVQTRLGAISGGGSEKVLWHARHLLGQFLEEASIDVP